MSSAEPENGTFHRMLPSEEFTQTFFPVTRIFGINSRKPCLIPERNLSDVRTKIQEQYDNA